jgi:uncharacterized protein (TIGR00730 family)
VAVFCGARHGEDPGFTQAARAVGEVLAGRGLTLVYGAGSVGLMGELADAALAHGGEVIGVIPRALADREIMHRGLSTTHVVASMHERKALMASLSDAFLALPGGFGTLDEVVEVITWLQLGIHDKPVGFLDVRGFWAPLMAAVDGFVRAGFVSPVMRDALLLGSDPAALLDEMARAGAPPDRWAASGAVP